MQPTDLKRFNRLRETFLTGEGPRPDYWTSKSDLEVYNRTFAQRIGWKLDYVFNQLAHLGWTPPAGDLLDWGCGTGIATQRFLERFGTDRHIYLWDRSPLALQFAARNLTDLGLQPGTLPSLPQSVGVLLILQSYYSTISLIFALLRSNLSAHTPLNPS